jgi:hypothetical protein
MSRRKRKIGGGERYIYLPHWILKSPAYLSLPGDAVKLLLAVWQRFNGVNNGDISYSCREAVAIGLTTPKAARMFGVLVDRGFLAITRNSKFAHKRVAREWRITAEKCGNEPATKEFMRWQPPSINGLTTKPAKLPITVPHVGLYGRRRPLQ